MVSRHAAAPAAVSEPDFVDLLAVLDGVACMEVFALAEVFAPPPLNARGRVDSRTRAGRAWQERMWALLRAVLELERDGLAAVVLPADGMHPSETGITDAGRRYLADMRAL